MIRVTPDQLREFIKPPGRSKRTAPAVARRRVFLSSSFRMQPQNAEQLRLLRKVFQEAFDVVGVEAASGRQLSKILRGVRDADVVLAETTYVVPNVLLELGMAFFFAGTQKKRTKRIFLLFNQDAPAHSIQDLAEPVRSLDILSYRFSEESLRRIRDTVYERLQMPVEPEEVMRVNIRGSPLRPRSDKKGVFLYYPADRRVWDTIVPELRRKLEASDLKLYTTIGAPSGSTKLEEVIFNVHRSSSALAVSCFVDTTGASCVDLPGAFALGAATAAGRGVERLVERGADRSADLSLWTEHTYEWANAEQLISHIGSATTATLLRRAKKGRR